MNIKIPYEELMIAILVIIMFVVSVSIGILSDDVDYVKDKVNTLDSKTLSDRQWK